MGTKQTLAFVKVHFARLRDLGHKGGQGPGGARGASPWPHASRVQSELRVPSSRTTTALRLGPRRLLSASSSGLVA